MSSSESTTEWPLPAFYFNVAIDYDMNDMAFQEVSGIETQVETEEYYEGGNNLIFHLPKSIKYSNLVLKRAIANYDSPIIKWCSSIINNQLSTLINTKSIIVSLHDSEGEPCRAWIFDNAYPVKIKIDSFTSTKNEVAVEEIEFCYSRSMRVI